MNLASVYDALRARAIAARALVQGDLDPRDARSEDPFSTVEDFRAVVRMVGMALTLDAATYVLEPNVVDLIDLAAASYAPGAHRLAEPCARTGFVWLPAPISVKLFDHPHGEQESLLQAYAWGQCANATVVSVFLGENTRTTAILVLMDGEDATPNQPELTWLRAFWAFVQQRVVASASTSVTRQVRRQEEREGRSVDNLRIVTLRRLSSPHAPVETHSVAWSHRWITSGHWRNQPYRRSGEVRPIWIWPYVKGPADKPLVTKATVFDVAR